MPSLVLLLHSWTGQLTRLNMSIVWAKFASIPIVPMDCSDLDSLSKKTCCIYTICVCVCVCVHVCIYIGNNRKVSCKLSILAEALVKYGLSSGQLSKKQVVQSCPFTSDFG